MVLEAERVGWERLAETEALSGRVARRATLNITRMAGMESAGRTLSIEGGKSSRKISTGLPTTRASTAS